MAELLRLTTKLGFRKNGNGRVVTTDNKAGLLLFNEDLPAASLFTLSGSANVCNKQCFTFIYYACLELVQKIYSVFLGILIQVILQGNIY